SPVERAQTSRVPARVVIQNLAATQVLNRRRLPVWYGQRLRNELDDEDLPTAPRVPWRLAGRFGWPHTGDGRGFWDSARRARVRGRAVAAPRPASARPVGDMTRFLEDLRGRGLAPRQILDVGAHRGDWSLLASGVFPEATFTLIEPQIEMGKDLEHFCLGHT